MSDERKQVVEYMASDIYLENKIFQPSTTIDSVIKSLQEFKNDGATHLNIDADWDVHDSLISIQLNPIKMRPETDKEYGKRRAREDNGRIAMEIRREEKEKEEYKRLQEKYG